MKILFRILLVLSIILFAFVAWGLLDAYVSLKYEVDEPRAMNKTGEELQIKAQYLHQFITWLWVGISYIFMIILICIRALLSKQV